MIEAIAPGEKRASRPRPMYLLTHKSTGTRIEVYEPISGFRRFLLRRFFGIECKKL